ncbi:MAG: hypothetical protein ACOC2H_00745 [Spirochaetota bacterium]
MKKNVPILFAFLLTGGLLTAEVPVKGGIHFYTATDPDSGDFYRNAVTSNLEFRKGFDKTALFIDIGAEYDTAQSSESVRTLYGTTIDASNASVNADHVNTTIEEEQKRVYLKEAYINQDFHVKGIEIIDSFSLKTGKIITNWGLSEYYSPVDVVNPQDYTFHVMKSKAERKMAVYAFSPSAYFSRHFMFDAVINPVFEQNREFSSSFNHENTRRFLTYTEGFGATFAGEEQPDPSIWKTSYGARLGLLFPVFEGHLMYYSGYNHAPTYELAGTEANPRVKAHYNRFDMVGIDFLSSLVWDINLKGEAAYYNSGKHFYLKEDEAASDLASGGDGTAESTSANYTLGFEVVKDFTGSAFLLNIEFNQYIIIDHTSDMKQNQLTNRILGEIQYRFADKKAYLKNATLYCIDESDIGAQFELGLKPEKNYAIKSGYWLFHEMDEGGYMGAYNDQSFVYIGGDMLF